MEIAAQIALGGMATLFLARRGDAPVVVKLIHEHLSSDWEVMRMFIDEALISVRLRHPSVVRVDELGEIDGNYFLVMEHVHGSSLAELLGVLHRRGRRLDPALASWIAAQVADGLHAAHTLHSEEGESLGVVHRDVSPQNILLSVHGEVKLTDFGVAKAGGRARRTREGEVRGKFRYMAPEQASGRPRDHRVDVFALGVVLWEMLTQRRLHEARGPDALFDAVRDPTIPPPSQHRSDVPSALDNVTGWATATDPARRPSEAGALARALRRAVPLTDGPQRLAALVQELVGPELVERAASLPAEMQRLLEVDRLREAVAQRAPPPRPTGFRRPPTTGISRSERRVLRAQERQQQELARRRSRRRLLLWLGAVVVAVILVATLFLAATLFA